MQTDSVCGTRAVRPSVPTPGHFPGGHHLSTHVRLYSTATREIIPLPYRRAIPLSRTNYYCNSTLLSRHVSSITVVSFKYQFIFNRMNQPASLLIVNNAWLCNVNNYFKLLILNYANQIQWWIFNNGILNKSKNKFCHFLFCLHYLALTYRQTQ